MTNHIDATNQTNQWSTFAVDTIKAALPVGGGSFLASLHTADEVLTFLTHLVGFCAAVVGFVWYVVRLKKDWRAVKSRR